MVKAAFIAEVIKFGYSRFLICLVPVIFAIYILGYLPNFYRSKELMAVSAKNSHIDTHRSGVRKNSSKSKIELMSVIMTVFLRRLSSACLKYHRRNHWSCDMS